MKWNVVTDSSCDLIPSDYRSDVIELSSVPFAISVGVRGYTDDEQLDIEEMLRDMEQEKTASYTSCPAPGAWLEQFEKADRTFAITISSQLSGSMNSALTARDLALEADPDKKIAVLDSRSTGPELVLCVREIERLAREGVGFDEAVNHANAFLDKTKVIFALSSFDNLIKNGRMHKMAGFLAKALGMWGHRQRKRRGPDRRRGQDARPGAHRSRACRVHEGVRVLGRQRCHQPLRQPCCCPGS
ncbi:DegV family protein [Senegalimassilia anaerobia]